MFNEIHRQKQDWYNAKCCCCCANLTTCISLQTPKIALSDEQAQDLFNAANALPLHDVNDYYAVELQTAVYEQLAAACPKTFQWLIDEIKSSLQKPPYYALVEGLKLDDGHRLFVAINRAFGELVASPFKKPRQQLVHHIHPRTDLPANSNKRYETENMHTDTADWPQPVKYISMACIRPDQNGGGWSHILDVHSLREAALNRLGADAVQMLETEAVPWAVADYQGGGVRWEPVLSENSLCWRRYTINQALANLEQELPEPLVRALDALADVIDDAPGKVAFFMNEGDLLFLDNQRTIHSRTPIAHPHESARLMIRSWIQTS